MEAPKGRYSVVEKDGRLIVIDNGTGAPIPSTFAPPSGRPGAGRSQSSAPISDSGPGPLDRAAGRLLALVVKRWDSQGRAVIAWEWQENGKVKRWDALLDEGQQRRMGRALLVLAAAPLLLVLAMMVDAGLFGLAILFAAPPLLWGFIALRRLHRETDDPGLRP
jgi:hypothetical protein